jgi:DNA invertase Pin-like site-specific DNA recombinase
MEKGVVLLRASSPRQRKSGLGIEAQRENVRRFAKWKRMTIVEYFVETKSGLSVSRPVFEAVIEACAKHKATLLIANVDRLSRRVLLIAALIESGIPFIAVDKPYADEFELHTAAAHAQKESRDISRRTKEALQMAKRRGVKLGTAVYKLHRKQRRAYKKFALKLKPRIKRYWNRGYNTVRKLTSILNEKHVKTFRSSKPYSPEKHWHLSTVHRLLKEINFP